jgi:hypothetical protein
MIQIIEDEWMIQIIEDEWLKLLKMIDSKYCKIDKIDDEIYWRWMILIIHKIYWRCMIQIIEDGWFKLLLDEW